MQRYFESLPRVAHIDMVPGRAVFMFSTTGTRGVQLNGREMSPDTLIRFSEEASAVSRTSGPACLASMSLPIETMETMEIGCGNGDCDPRRDSVVITPSADAMTRLQKLHAAAGHLSEHAPEVLASPEATSSLERALTDALADCLNNPATQEPASRNRSHDATVKRFYEMLRANPDDVLHIPEICKAIGVSARTLNTCCNDILGMSPYHYLKLRQMNLARGALTRAHPAASSVTQIATDHGFWDLGRFATSYRAMFGERPSDTLRRDPRSDQTGFADPLFWRSSEST